MVGLHEFRERGFTFEREVERKETMLTYVRSVGVDEVIMEIMSDGIEESNVLYVELDEFVRGIGVDGMMEETMSDKIVMYIVKDVIETTKKKFDEGNVIKVKQ